MTRTFCLCVIAMAVAGALAGCCCPCRPAGCSGEPQATVASSIQGMGGLDNWKCICRVQATAVVTYYCGCTGMIWQQQQEYDLSAGTLTACGELPEGPWQAVVHLDGRQCFQDTSKCITSKERSQLAYSMLTALRRAYGTLRLGGYGPSPQERATSVSTATILGIDYFRIGVSDGMEDIKAFYLDPQTYLPVYVTVGADCPGGRGTITKYRWTTLCNGVAFPSKIEVFNIGRDVLVGYTPVLEVELRDIAVFTRQ